MIANVLVFCSNIGLTIIDVYSEMFENFSQLIDIPGFGQMSIFDLIFTYGITTFITVTLIKWVIGIIT